MKSDKCLKRSDVWWRREVNAHLNLITVDISQRLLTRLVLEPRTLQPPTPLHSPVKACMPLRNSLRDTHTVDRQKHGSGLYGAAGPPQTPKSCTIILRELLTLGQIVKCPSWPPSEAQKRVFYLLNVALVDSNSTQLLAPISAAWRRWKYRVAEAVFRSGGRWTPSDNLRRGVWGW